MDDAERLRLYLTLTVLDKLEPDQSWDRLAHLLQRGIESEYGDLDRLLDPPIAAWVTGELREILTMFEALADSASVEDDGQVHHRLRPAGFDFNSKEEGQFATVASYLSSRDYWPSLQPYHENSHMPMLPRYRAMLRVFEKTHNEGRDYRSEPLTREQVEAIQTAGQAAGRAV